MSFSITLGEIDNNLRNPISNYNRLTVQNSKGLGSKTIYLRIFRYDWNIQSAMTALNPFKDISEYLHQLIVSKGYQLTREIKNVVSFKMANFKRRKNLDERLLSNFYSRILTFLLVTHFHSPNPN